MRSCGETGSEEWEGGVRSGRGSRVRSGRGEYEEWEGGVE